MRMCQFTTGSIYSYVRDHKMQYEKASDEENAYTYFLNIKT